MRKRNFKFCLAFVALICGAFLMSACSNNAKAYFVNSQITIGTNQEIELKDYVVFENISLNELVFKTSDPNVAIITPRQTLVAGQSEGQAIITIDGFDGAMEVNVRGRASSFSAPANLRFNQDTGRLEWNNVYSGDVMASTFKVTISQNGENPQSVIVNKNYFEVDSFGSFEVTVSCQSFAGVKASEESEVYTFTKLSAPYNVEYDDNTKTLSWQSDDGNSAFYIVKNGVAGDVTYDKFYKMSLADAQTYSIKVMSYPQNSEGNVFGASSEELTFTRLKAPNLNIANGVVSWSDNQQGVSEYALELYDVNNDTLTLKSTQSISHNGTDYSYKLENVAGGTYAVKIKAVGDSTNSKYTSKNKFVSSEYSQTDTLTKLVKPALAFDKATKKLSIVNYDATAKYVLYLNGKQTNVDFAKGNGSYDYYFSNAGEYNFTLVKEAVSYGEINSDFSDRLTVIKLAEITSVKQSVSNSNYQLSGLTLNNANMFVVKKTYSGVTTTLKTIETSSDNLGSIDTIFADAGDYVITITATTKSGTETLNYYVLDSVTTLNVKRLSNLSILDNQEERKIEWETSDDLEGVVYEYTLVGPLSTTSTTRDTFLNYANLPAGAYTITVNVSASNLQNTLVLPANESATKSFRVTKKLLTPAVSLSRSDNYYSLNITPVENATEYYIRINNGAWVKQESTSSDTIIYSLEGLLNSTSATGNLIEVYAKNSSIEFYLDSELAILNVVKINAPEHFTLSSSEVLSIEINYKYILKADVLIDGQSASALTKSKTEFEVKTRFVSDVKNYNGTFYIDSDWATFTLKRLPITVNALGQIISWNSPSISQRYSNIINISQNGKNFSSQVNQTYVDLSTFDFGNFNLDFTRAFTGYVSCVFGDITGNITEDENIYYINNESNSFTIMPANAEIGVNVVESAGKLNVSWQGKQGYTYSLYDSFTNHENLTENSIAIDIANFLTAKTYLLTLNEQKDTELNVYLINVTRLAPVSTLKVDKDEKLVVEKQTGASNVVIVKAGQELDNLNDISVNAEMITVKYKALAKVNDFTFYLDSATKSYTFARLVNEFDNLILESQKVDEEYLYVLSWSQDTTATYTCELKFCNSDNNFVVTLLDSETSINLLSSKYQNILKQLSGQKFLSFKKTIGEFTATEDSVNYLSSTYSSPKELKIITAPTNIVVSAIDNPDQNNVQITWTQESSNFDISGYVVSIEHNGTKTLLESSGAFSNAGTDYFMAEGNWVVKVRALGSNNSITSDFSESVIVRRLTSIATIKLSQDGIISWSEIKNATGYLVKYSYQDLNGNMVSNSINVAGGVTQTDIFASEINTEFEGNIYVTVYALGDGTSTLSSVSTKTFSRLSSPQIVTQNDRIVIQNYLKYPQNTKFFVNATLDGNVVINKLVNVALDENNNYSWLLPTTFSYIDQNGQTQIIEVDTIKDLTFSMYATNQSEVNFNSNVVENTLKVLANLSNLRFSRNNSGMIEFNANNVNDAEFDIKMTVGNFVKVFNGTISLEITDQILKAFDSNWTIKLQAIGKTKDSVTYINGKEIYISGKKLASIKEITVKNGEITWQSILGANDYKMLISKNLSGNVVEKSGYLTRVETLRDEQFGSGELLVSLRAVGNVKNAEISENIILDGDYSQDFTVTKLSEIADFDVRLGFFSFTEIAKATEYVVEVYSDLSQKPLAEYKLEKNVILPLEGSTSYYFSTALNNKLAEVGELYLKVYNKTNEEGYVYSNYAKIEYSGMIEDYIKVANLNNVNSSVELYHPYLSNGTEKDYADTYAKWTQNTNASPTYIVCIDNDTYQFTVANFIKLDDKREWSAGEHTIKYIQLGGTGLSGSASERIAYLTYKFSENVTVTKLAPVVLELTASTTSEDEVCVTYRAIAGADKYYGYLNDTYYKEFSNSSREISFDDLDENKTYDSFGMMSVSTTNINYIASTLSYLTVIDYTAQTVRVVKLAKTKAPKAPTFKNGAFYFDIGTTGWIKLLSGESTSLDTEPIELDQDAVANMRINLKFISKSAPVKEYKYTDDIRNYLTLSNSTIDIITALIKPSLTDEQLVEYGKVLKQLQGLLGNGFSSVTYGFNKFAENLPVGAYDVQVSIIGKGIVQDEESGDYTVRFSSNYLSIGTKYVAPAPSVVAVAKGGLYSLEFNQVSVDSNYISGTPEYNLIGVYRDEEGNLHEQVIDKVSTDAKTIDLTSLIEAGTLNEAYEELYLNVAGNNSNVLNGKVSNIIKIGILCETEVKVVHGVMQWQSFAFANKYQIAFTEKGKDNKQVNDIPVTEFGEDVILTWDPVDLRVNTEYIVTIQMCGLVDARISGSDTFMMSGKIVSLGSVIKLQAISSEANGVDIENGIFTWSPIANATSYDVYYKTAQSGTALNGKETISSAGAHAYYEPEVADRDIYNYYFMAIGTEEGEVNSTTTTYVNSPISNYNSAARVDNIKSVEFKDGVITFKPSPSEATGYYKLTFFKLDSKGERGEKVEVYIEQTNYDTNTNSALTSAGRYEVIIQALLKGKQSFTSASGEIAYYVISTQVSIDYYKFDAVNIVAVNNGRIKWTFNNDGNISESDFEFRLEFTSPNKEKVIKIVPSSNYFVDTDGKKYYYFEDVVYNDISTNEPITVNIYVTATSSALGNYVKSVVAEYRDINGDIINIYQYQKVDESKIKISITDSSQLKVDWKDGVSGLADGFMYEISVSVDGGAEKIFTTNSAEFVTGEGNDISFNITGEYVVVFKIRVIPTRDNYISSAWSNKKEITRPKSITGFTYDEEKCLFTWDDYEASANWDSYTYKITDIVTYRNSDGELVKEVYIITVSLSETNNNHPIASYQPFVIGTHSVSVAVMVANSADDSNFMSEYVTISGVDFDLFASGDGTQANPYLISSAEQFANIKYRMSKDYKNCTYYHGRVEVIDDEETIVLDKEPTVVAEKSYYFKQTTSITLVKNATIDQTLNAKEVEDFDNIYDGDFYALKLSYSKPNKESGIAQVSIFKTLSKNAVVKNLNLKLEISSLSSDGKIYGGSDAVANINLICYQNNGTITNIAIGGTENERETITLDIVSVDLYLSFIAYFNNGTISNVENFYNVKIVDSYMQYQSRLSYASMVINNSGVLQFVKNNGDISISGSEIYLGGLVVINQSNDQNQIKASVTSSANAGNINVYYRTSSVSDDIYVGGLIGKNQDASLSYCYSVGTITVGSANTCKTYVGGLVGLFNGLSTAYNMSYCYSYVTLVNQTNQTLTKTFTMCQLVGNLLSASSTVTCVYYNALSGFTSGCDSVGAMSYSTIDEILSDSIDLYGTSDYAFNRSDLDSSYNSPKLNFEAKYRNEVLDNLKN